MQRDFSAISTLNLWRLANCIVECFNQKDYTMYANCETVHLKEIWGNLSHKMSTNSVSSTQSLTLKPPKPSYRCWQSHITVSNKVKAWVIHCIMLLVSHEKKNRSGPSYQRPCVGGQDCPERGFLHVLDQAALFPSN